MEPVLYKPRHNYRYVCAELIRLYYRGQELLSDVYNALIFNTSPFLIRRYEVRKYSQFISALTRFGSLRVESQYRGGCYREEGLSAPLKGGPATLSAGGTWSEGGAAITSNSLYCYSS